MSRLDTVRNRTVKVKERVGPRAANARESAAEYADKLTPRVEAARSAVAPRLETAREAVAPRYEQAKEAVGPHLETAREKVRDDLLPKVAGAAAAALAASEPVRDEARSRGIATLAALKGEVTPHDVAKAKHRTRGRLRRFVLLAALAGGLAGAWRWWKRQGEPDWNVDEFRAPAASTAAEPAAGDTARSATDSGSLSTQPADTAAASPGEALSDAADREERLEEATGQEAWRGARR